MQPSLSVCVIVVCKHSSLCLKLVVLKASIPSGTFSMHVRHGSLVYIKVRVWHILVHFCGYAWDCTWCACDYHEMSHSVWQHVRISGHWSYLFYEQTCNGVVLSLSKHRVCSWNAQMPFIIVHLDLAIALLRLTDTRSHTNFAWPWLLEMKKMGIVSKSPCGISK